MLTQPDPNRWNLNEKRQNGASAPAPRGDQSGTPAKPPPLEKTTRPDVTYDDEDDGELIHFLF